jgi:hypothetical protein
MRVLVIPEKAATPEINWYEFQKRIAACRYAISKAELTLPRFGSAQRLSQRCEIHEQNQ